MVYRLYYFNGRGLGEPIRMIFQLAGESFEDIRIDEADWPLYRPKMPSGLMPVLDVDGLLIPQSAAITRYLAKKFGFAGKTLEEEAWVDALVDQFKDYYKEISDYYYTAVGLDDRGNEEELFKRVFVSARDKHFGLLNDRLKKSGKGFLVGDSLTWADLVWTDHITTLLKINPNILNDFPEVLALKKRVDSIPQIKKWIETRPDTRF